MTGKRNAKLFDIWSLTHVVWGIALGWVMPPFIAVSLLVLYEPLEIFGLYPLLKRFGIIFGYESLQNSLADIIFDIIGVALGTWLLAKLFAPPFHLF